VGEIYAKLGLPDDRLMAETRARAGDVYMARKWYQRRLEIDATDPYVLGDYAGFLLWYASDAEQAIAIGKRGYELAPYPLLQQTIAAAYLSLSGQHLGRGQLSAAAEAYAEASDMKFDENYVLQLCWQTCEEIRAAITAFR
jgi:hypothetical protein